MMEVPMEERIALSSNFSSAIDKHWKLDNFAAPRMLKITRKLSVEGFRSSHGIDNYLNIPFARVAGRFLPSRKLDLEHISGRLEADLYGPRCPQPVNPSKWTIAHNFEKLSATQRMSEFDCLNLNVYTPPECSASTVTKLPVFVYIHGGAFSFGDGLSEKDGNHLVKRSIDAGQPIIVVTVQYRLGLFGFLTSEEILEEQRACGYKPVRALGIHDQSIALQWVQSNIHHFGGDASNVSLAGESAGSVSIWYQIKGRVPRLFKRCMLRSFPPGQTYPMQEVQTIFDSIVEKLGISKDAPSAVKVAAMKSLTPKELISYWDGTAFGPVPDPDFLVEADPNGPGFQDVDYWIDLPPWVEEISMGCTADETVSWACNLWTNTTWQDAERQLRQALPSEVFDRVRKSPVYANASSPYEALMRITSEGAFIGPTIYASNRLAIKGSVPVYFYIMDTPEHHPGPHQGAAPHGGDIPYVFCQPPLLQYPEMGAAIDRLSESIFRFAYGQGAWEDLRKSGRYCSFNGTRTGLKNLQEERKALTVPVADEKMMTTFRLSCLQIVTDAIKVRTAATRAV